MLNTFAQRGGLSQLEIAKWSGRADQKQNRTYNHMSEYEMVAKAEALDTSLTLFGPSGEIEKHLPITIQEFNTMEKGAVHVTEFGVCVHDFTMTPCEKYRDCLNCHEQVCIKGENEKLIRIKARLSDVEQQFQAAENAMNEGLSGADRWYEYHKNTLDRLLELISILEHPDIEDGAQIKLRNDKSFSPLRRASARQDFSRKLKWEPSDFSGEKLSWRLLPSAVRVRPASAAAHNSPPVRCTPLAYANDLTPCRMALHFDYASAAAPTSSKRPAPTATQGSSYTAPLALRFLYSFIEFKRPKNELDNPEQTQFTDDMTKLVRGGLG